MGIGPPADGQKVLVIPCEIQTDYAPFAVWRYQVTVPVFSCCSASPTQLSLVSDETVQRKKLMVTTFSHNAPLRLRWQGVEAGQTPRRFEVISCNLTTTERPSGLFETNEEFCVTYQPNSTFGSSQDGLVFASPEQPDVRLYVPLNYRNAEHISVAPSAGAFFGTLEVWATALAAWLAALVELRPADGSTEGTRIMRT